MNGILSPWSAGGNVSVSAGQLSINGARFNSEPSTTTYGPGTTLEFVATFNGAANQHIGFGSGTDEVEPGPGIYNTSPMAAFSTGSSGSAVITHVWPDGGGGFVDYTIPLSLIGTPHSYRIDWKPTSLDFYVDGSLVHTESLTIATSMRPAASDYAFDGTSLQVDSIHVTPYASSGTFTSRVFGSTTDTTWGAVIWNDTVPSGTSIAIYARTGDTAIPDGTWTPFTLVPTSGSSLGVTSKYIQYRADLSTGDPALTPVLNSVSISCDGISSSSGPIISNVNATPGTNGTTATIAWDTDVPSTTRVDYGTSGGALGSNVYDGNLVTSHSIQLTNLTPSTAYDFRVTSVDGLSVSSSSPVSPGVLTFNTPFSYGCPCSIWNNTDTPANTVGGDTNSVEVGVKFRSSVSGYITGIKFYQGSTSVGPYTGHLWDRSGNLLGSLSFTSVSGSGWQVAYFNAPIAVSANTTYVASYFAPSGNYTYTQNVFGTNGVDTPPLRALSSIDDAFNGVYKYSPSSIFPTDSFNDSNYWVDVVFDTSDTVPPVISNIVATPGIGGTTAAITWTTDELSNSRVDYGTDQNNLDLKSHRRHSGHKPYH